ncbi:aspartyl protease family protein [Salinimicrobium gaetbulicola]|uniref:Aspartyl protease family protein n=1 Tax=Salinimicrobium gaetbulicola TaxID=999702 RepID=A0ABW3IFT5_9FLAO
MLKTSPLVLIFFLFTLSTYCQEGFFIEKGRRSAKIKFDLVNNLMIIPVELNGQELSFLLDTGVSTTVLLNLEEVDSVMLKNAQKINLRGLGGEELIEAYKTHGNELKIGKVTSKNMDVFLIFTKEVNFSPRLGVPVNGIIGYDFFKDFIVEVNYARRFIRAHDPNQFRKGLSGYKELPLRFFQNKPYINSTVQIMDRKTDVTLLLDSGLGDAVWLFSEDAGIQVPEKSFDDLLGLGLLGDVTGKRSRINSLELGNYELKEVSAAFPDSLSLQGLKLFEMRNGSLGGEILRRFNMVFDYRAERLFLRKNRFFDDPFNYDMSGLIIEHSGFVIVESTVAVYESNGYRRTEGKEIVLETGLQNRKTFELKRAFKIVGVRKDSPAHRAGLQVGDELVKINGRDIFRYDLDEIISLLASEEGKLIKLVVNRGLASLKFEFRLEKVL